MSHSIPIITSSKHHFRAAKQAGIALWLLLLLSSCQPAKYLSQDELLYDGAQIELLHSRPVPRAKQLKKQLLRQTRPQKNSALQLWIYNHFYRPEREEGPFNWVASRLGQAPRLYTSENARRSQTLMEKYLRDHGFFEARINRDTNQTGPQKVRVHYQIRDLNQARFGPLDVPTDSIGTLGALLQHQANETWIKTGAPYQLAALQAERERITQLAKNKGYYHFRPDDIYYFVDTTRQLGQADIYLRINEPESLRQYYIDTPVLYPTYQLNPTSLTDSLTYKDLRIIQSQTYLKAATLRRIVTQHSGALYSEQLQEQTINHLLDLGVFKFVNLQYETFTRNDTSRLRPHIYLTPALSQQVNAELEASTESTNFLGSTLRGSYTHHNLFKGAERLEIRLSAGVETQINNPELPFVNTLELSARASLEIPRFLNPFGHRPNYGYYIPRTLILVNNDYQERTGFFTLNAFRTELGYRWQDNQYRKHHLIPLGMHLIRLISTSPEFEALLTQNSRLRQGFDNTAILGMTYRFTYNEQQLNLIKNYLYFQGTIETSGNVANWLAGSNPETEQAPFSQFLKLDSDLRYTLQGLRQSGVARLAIGVGYSYHHSQVMPYARQYFVGGANSIRAFQLRSVGPGGVVPDPDNTGSFFDQTGDIKLEANLEYRFDALPYTEGALFVDAGNIYLLRNPTNELRLQDGLFHWDQFYQQLAVGAGAGLRLDLNFVLLRFDVALPLRVPSLPANQRWVIDEIALGQKNWRQSNLAYNIAIGYPF